MGIFNSAIFNNSVFNTGMVAIDSHDGASSDDLKKYRQRLQRQANARNEYVESLNPLEPNVKIQIVRSPDVVYELSQYDIELLLLMSSL